MLTHSDRSADIQIQVARSRLDCCLHPGAGILAAAAGGYQRFLAGFEKFLYLWDVQITEVKPDFGHLHEGVVKYCQYLF